MKKNYLKYTFFFVVAAVVIFIIGHSLNQPGIADLKTEFEEVAFYRNENNTGPVLRVYAVTVSDTVWDDMEKYAGFLPHNKYGNTKVYFFFKNQPYPTTVIAGEKNFEEEFERFVLAKYEKDGLGRESFMVQ